MVKVFIIYGNKEGEKVAKVVYDFLRNVKGMNSIFLASPDVPAMNAGEHLKDIIPKLDRSNVVIVIGTPGLSKSNVAMGEIVRAKASSKWIIPYVRGNTELPEPIRKIWKVRFRKGEFRKNSNLEKLYSSIWKFIDTKIDWTVSIAAAGRRISTTKLRLKMGGRR